MRIYELPIIVEPNTDKEGVTAVVDSVKQYIATVNGEVTSADVWGRKTLAYPINKYREGTYVLFKIKLDPSAISELERTLKLMEKIIRYMLIVKEES